MRMTNKECGVCACVCVFFVFFGGAGKGKNTIVTVGGSLQR